MTKCLFLVFSFAILRITVVTSCRQPCRTVEPIRGFCLRERSFKTYNSRTLEACIFMCEQDAGCLSINYFKRTSLCKLNNSSKDDAIEHFVQDNACLYIENVLRQQYLPLEPGPRCKSANDSRALGMRSGEIQDTQITGSTSEINYEPYTGRLGSSTGWMTLVSSSDKFIQVSFEDARRILTAVASQGSSVHLCWVKKYTIEYKTDWNRLDWETYPQSFQGNTDMKTVVKNAISQPFRTTAVRLRPQDWHGRICMRIELYGCKEGF